MAKTKGRSYNAFLREIKASKGLSQKQAQEAYRVAKEKLGRTPTGADVRKRPAEIAAITKTAKTRITKAENAAKREAERLAAKKEATAEKRRATIAAKKAAAARPPAPAAPPAAPAPIPIRDAQTWNQTAPWLWKGARERNYHAGVSYSYTDKTAKQAKKHDLRIEILVRIKQPDQVLMTREMLKEAVIFRRETGKDFSGIEVVQMSWTRDDGARRSARSGSNIDEAFGNLGRIIDAGNFSVDIQ